MYYHVTNAACLKDYFVHLEFEDGTKGVIDLSKIVREWDAFSPLKDKKLFCKMKIDERFHTIEWPNGTDLSPKVLYEKIKNGGGSPVNY